MIIYLILSKCKIRQDERKTILQKLNLLAIQTCESWIKTLREEDDLICIERDLRGSYKKFMRNLYYELYVY